MRKSITKALGAIVALSVLLTLVNPVSACTGVIVGSDLTEDGSVIFGRTEDLEINHNKVFKIHEAGERKANETIKDVSYDEEHGYEYTLTHDSYRYTSISDTTPEYGFFDEAGYNEKGLIADMTVSASANDKVAEVDPYVDGSAEDGKVGVSEAVITTVVLGSADSARAAVELVANEVATKGAAEGNGFVVADKNELWYVEVYTGHQFVAMKYPSDKFSVFPNSFWLNEVVLEPGEETENYIVSADDNFIYSKGIFEVAKKAGTFVGDEAKHTIDLYKSYAKEELSDSNVSRACSGILALNPKANVNLENKDYSFLQSMDGKVGLEQVFAFTRNRLENVGIKANDLGRNIEYPIGNRNTMEAHIFRIPSDANAENPGSMWLSLGSPMTSAYVQYYPNQTAAIAEAQNESNDPVADSVYWTAMDILHMVEVNRDEFAPIVSAKIAEVEKKFLANQGATNMTPEEATAKNNEDARTALAAMKEVQKEIKALKDEYLKNNDYTYTFFGRRKTAAFTGSTLEVSKGTSEEAIKLAVKIADKTNGTLTLVDPYGNPIEKLANPVTLSIPKAAFGETTTAPVFKAGEETLEATEKDDKYVLTLNSASISYTLASAEEAPQATPAATGDNSLLIGLGVIAVVAIAVNLINKSKKQ